MKYLLFAGKGGLDSLVLHLVHRHKIPVGLEGLGIGDMYRFDVGSRDELLRNYGLDVESIVKAARRG